MSWLGEFLAKLFGLSKASRASYTWKKRNVTRATSGSIIKWNQFGVDHNIDKVDGISKSAKKVYLYLSRVSDRNGDSIPFIGTIAKRTKVSKSTINKAVKELEKAGLLQTEKRYSRRGGSSNLYHLKKVAVVYPAAVKASTGKSTNAVHTEQKQR